MTNRSPAEALVIARSRINYRQTRSFPIFPIFGHRLGEIECVPFSWGEISTKAKSERRIKYCLRCCCCFPQCGVVRSVKQVSSVRYFLLLLSLSKGERIPPRPRSLASSASFVPPHYLFLPRARAARSLDRGERRETKNEHLPNCGFNISRPHLNDPVLFFHHYWSLLLPPRS